MVKKKFCGTDCLRLDLDENGETLLEQTIELENELESEEALIPDAEQLQAYANSIGFFDQDLDRFKKECLKCSSFKSNGKVANFEEILKRAKACLGDLHSLKLNSQPKEADHAE